MDISIVLPAYREADNLKSILPQLKEVMNSINKEYEILVIDTMQQMDNSIEICEEFKAKYIARQNGNFYGDAIRTGIEKATGEFLVIMDSDGSHDPKYILKFIDVQQDTNCNLVIGSRYCEGGDSHNGLILKLMSRVLNLTYRIVFGIDAQDVSDSFRLYELSYLKQLNLECDNFDIVEEILIQLTTKFENFKIVEVPIYFKKRLYGTSKRNLIVFIFSYIQTMLRLYRIKIKMQNKKK